MTPQELKNSILQLAIQGKLVEQRADEGTGKELLRDILTQRRRDAEVGRSPRDRRVSARNGGRGATALPPIPDAEKPFDIPESWEWVRLGEIGSWASGATPSRTHSEYYGGSIPWLKTGDLTDGYVSSIPEFITDLALEKNSVRLNPVGSVLMAMYGATIGKLGILQIAATTNQACCACIPYDGVWNKYLFYYLMARRKAFIKMGEGGAQPNISKEKIVNALIPLPPLAEQKRIVAKIEELLPLVDRYEKAWSRLKDFNKRFPIDMQKSLLQMAIQGKLVEQKADEGTGAELLEKILAAKNAEGAKGKGEKSHAKSAKSAKVGSCVSREEIPDDEKPFDIPESWEWARLGEVFAHNTGKAMNSSAKFSHKVGAIRKFITTSNLYWGSFDFANVKEMFFSEEELPRCTVTKNDILVCEGGAYYGRTAIWNYDYDMCFQNHIHRLRSYVKVEEKYFYYVFRLYRESGMMKSQGTAMPGLSSKVLHELTIPLPPLAEQKRIVAKLEELLPLCERLKSESNSAANS